MFFGIFHRQMFFNIYSSTYLIPIDDKMPKFPTPPTKILAETHGQYDQLMTQWQARLYLCVLPPFGVWCFASSPAGKSTFCVPCVLLASSASWILVRAPHVLCRPRQPLFLSFILILYLKWNTFSYFNCMFNSESPNKKSCHPPYKINKQTKSSDRGLHYYCL